MRAITHRIVVACVVLVGCGPAPGTQSHDMSAAQHQAMARGEEQNAAEHAAQFDPAAKVERTGCGLASRAGEGCWSSVSNPTAAHVAEVERHRKLAAEHRAASQALRDAEAVACVGLSESDRDMSPFAHREDIAGVESVVTGGAGSASASSPRSIPQTRGAIIVFRATRGMTAQWLQRVVDCHLARNAALGHDAREMPYCPLMPKDVVAHVTPRESGFAVEVTSNEPATVQEVVRRAQALVAR